MKLFGSKQWRGFGKCRVLMAVFFSTEAPVSSSPGIESLFERISSFRDRTISIVPVLDQWVHEGNPVPQSELQTIIKQLRKYRRFSHALQISEWMVSDGKNYDLSSGDVAIRLDLISKVRGLNKAEEYFDSIPFGSRIDKVHGALLNCYAENKSLEKAERLFNEMRESGFAGCPLHYNVLLSLYSHLGKNEKVETLLREMEESGVEFNRITFNIRLKYCVSTRDLEGMERLLEETEADPSAYIIAADGYSKAGLHEKALVVLRRAEEAIYRTGKRDGFEQLLPLYASVSKRDEIYRIWDLYRRTGKVYNSGYLSMLTSLVKVDDFDGAEKVFEELESRDARSDIGKIASYLVSAYCKKGLLGKALSCAERLERSGRELDSSSWQCIANRCCREGEMAKAVEAMKKAAKAEQPRWTVRLSTLASCLEYLKREGDLEIAREVLGLLGKRDSLSSDECSRLMGFVDSDRDSLEDSKWRSSVIREQVKMMVNDNVV